MLSIGRGEDKERKYQAPWEACSPVQSGQEGVTQHWHVDTRFLTRSQTAFSERRCTCSLRARATTPWWPGLWQRRAWRQPSAQATPSLGTDRRAARSPTCASQAQFGHWVQVSRAPPGCTCSRGSEPRPFLGFIPHGEPGDICLQPSSPGYLKALSAKTSSVESHPKEATPEGRSSLPA